MKFLNIKNLLVVGILLLFCSSTFAQRGLFQTYQGQIDATQQKIVDRMLSKHYTLSVRVVKIDPIILQSNTVYLNLSESANYTVNYRGIGETGVKADESWTGNFPELMGSVCFNRYGNRITGKISSVEGSWGIYPISEDGLHAILEYGEFGGTCGNDHASNEATEPHETHEGHNHDDHSSPAQEPALDIPQQNGSNEVVTESLSSSAGNGFECNVRVIIAYTALAKTNTLADFGVSMKELMDLAVLETNQGYANSNVVQRMEIAYLYETNYTESGGSSAAISADLVRFQTPGDGHMDEVFDWRERYDADMSALIHGGPFVSLWGRAAGFDYTDPADAFQVTVYDCATGNFTFAHEFGHTQGCRHQNDGNTTPWAHGHGYYGSDFRTVMGTCCFATRVNYWSNPDVFFSGETTGIANTNDNARALDDGDAVTSSLQVTPLNYTMPTDVINDDEFADAYATNDLTLNSYTAEIDSEVELRAGNSITLADGFHAKSGSLVTGYIFANCPGTPLSIQSDPNEVALQQEEISEMEAIKANSIQLNSSEMSLTSYPNPFTTSTTLEYNVPKTGEVSLAIFDLYGKQIKGLVSANMEAGNYKYNLSSDDLPTGTFLCVLQNEGQKKVRKIVVIK